MAEEVILNLEVSLQRGMSEIERRKGEELPKARQHVEPPFNVIAHAWKIDNAVEEAESSEMKGTAFRFAVEETCVLRRRPARQFDQWHSEPSANSPLTLFTKGRESHTLTL